MFTGEKYLGYMISYMARKKAMKINKFYNMISYKYHGYQRNFVLYTK